MASNLKSILVFGPLCFLAVLATFISLSLALYQPDRPVATIEPGSSVGPSFVVQIIRPRLGLPVGGLLPPKIFGQEEYLGFGAESEGAFVGLVDPGRLELHADGWDLRLVLDGHGGVAAESEVVFTFMFEQRLRRVRGRPGDPAVGTVAITQAPGEAEFSGRFDVELARCEDAESGEPLGWPPKPLVLHGSFDRLRPSDQGGEAGSPAPVRNRSR